MTIALRLPPGETSRALAGRMADAAWGAVAADRPLLERRPWERAAIRRALRAGWQTIPRVRARRRGLLLLEVPGGLSAFASRLACRLVCPLRPPLAGGARFERATASLPLVFALFLRSRLVRACAVLPEAERARRSARLRAFLSLDA